MSEPNPLDQALSLQAQPDGSWLGATSPVYANMVGPFGGVSAAQVLQAVWSHPQRLGEPVALTVNYCAVLADGPFTVVAQPLRTNRSTQHWQVQVLQEQQVVLSATVMTAARRDTWRADELAAPAAPPPEQVPITPGPARVKWTSCYEMRFIEGALPTVWDGADGGSTRTLMWLRDKPLRALDFFALTAMADVFFPRIWRRRAVYVPVGTVTMSVYFHTSLARLQGLGCAYVLGQAKAQAFYNGYFDQSAQLWSEAGELLATSHQMVYYKE